MHEAFAAPRLKRVLVLVATVNMGGAEIQALRNCEVLLQAGHRVTLVTVFKTDKDFFADYLRALLVRYPGLEHASLLDYVPPPTVNWRTGLHKLTSGMPRLRKMLVSRQFDVLYTRSWPCSMLAWLAQLGLRHGPRLIFNEENSLRHNPSKLKGLLRLFLLNRAHAWLVPCHGLYKEAIALQVAPDRGDVLPNIVRMPEAFEPPDTEGRSLQIGFLGRLEAQKGLERLSDVLERVALAGGRFHVRIGGAGSQEAALREDLMARGLSARVTFLGPVRDLAAFFRTVDVLVLTSHYEGFANVLIEANAHGVPVVAMDAPHGPADIVSNGVNGFLVPNGDVVAMAECLRRTPAETFRHMATTSREVAERHFSLEAQAARWARLLSAS